MKSIHSIRRLYFTGILISLVLFGISFVNILAKIFGYHVPKTIRVDLPFLEEVNTLHFSVGLCAISLFTVLYCFFRIQTGKK